MEITDEQIAAIFGASPFVARRKIDKSGYEVLQQTNEDWLDTVGTDEDFQHCGDFQTEEEAVTVQQRLHVRWVLRGV